VKGDLERLIAAVEAGTADAQAFGTAFRLSHSVQVAMTARAAYLGSLNAALRLHEALLPGWDWLIVREGDNYRAVIARRDDHQGGLEAEADDPARAWLLAILRALAKREEG
jgi:hypothetical protein